MFKKISFTLLVGLGVQTQAWADFYHTPRAEFFGGPMAMRIMLDNGQREATAIGGGVGVNVIESKYGTISLDSFFTRTISSAIGKDGVEFDANSLMLGAAYRSPHRVFAIAKAGWVVTQFDAQSEDVNTTESGMALSVGLGAEVIPNLDVELEYIQTSGEFGIARLGFVFSQ